MYDRFKLGWCNRASIDPAQLTKEAEALIKEAYAEAYTVPGQPQQQPKPSGGFPWARMAGLGLLAAGGAYAHGKLSAGSPMSGFSSMVDQNVVNPIMGQIHNYTQNPQDQMQQMQGRVNGAAFDGQFKGITRPSQLQGTDYEFPNNLQTAGNVAGGVGGVGLLGAAGRPIARGALLGGASRFIPNFIAKPLAGIARSPALKMMGRASGPLAALTTIPDTLQLGDKINDHFNVDNPYARAAIKGGTVLGGGAMAMGGSAMGGAIGGVLGGGGGTLAEPGGGTVVGGLGGAGIGSMIGGFGGAMGPQIANDLWNRHNANQLLTNQTQARAGALKDEFTNAMQEKGYGNMNPLKAWYGMQTDPKMLQMTIDQYKDDPALQQQIRSNVGT